VPRRGRLRDEARAIARQGLLLTRAVLRREAPAAGPRVAVFIHGFMAGPAVFDPMRAHVERATSLPTIAFGYPPVGRFEAIAKRLSEFIDRTAPADAALVLVGHSLGGLLARWYLQELAGHRRVERLVMLATPHAGTQSALLAPRAFALHPGSAIIRRLSARREAHAGIPHVSIVAGRDRLCIPPSSAAGLPGATVVWIDDLGHNEMLFDPRVLAAVVDAFAH
jgi:pimeloyl-ACP methyl ester carboxylesterase